MKTHFSLSRILRPLLVASLVIVAACGSDDDDGSTSIVVNNPPGEQQREEEGPISTRPIVIMNTKLESNVFFNVTNKTRVENDIYFMEWQCGNIEPIEYKQYIHVGSSCPTVAKSDFNGDGYLDTVEVEQSVGAGVLALDSNLDSEAEDAFPVAVGASYTYSDSIPLPLLRQFIPAGEDFMVIVYGIDPTIELPATIANNTADEVHSTIPISCTVFEAPPLISEEPTDGGATSGETTGDSTTGATTGGATSGGTTNGGATTGATTGGTTNGGATTGATTGGTTNGGVTTGATTGGTTNGGVTTGATTGGTTNGGATTGATTGGTTNGGVTTGATTGGTNGTATGG